MEEQIADTSQIITPALVVFRERLAENLAKMVEIAGDAKRLRPHCKTHKMPAVAKLQLELGITKHKAATFAEAEMLATAGAPDVFLAYNLVGPNMTRAVQFQERFPNVQLSVTGDNATALQQLGETLTSSGQQLDVLLDIDTGQHRTGVPCGPAAADLYKVIVETPGLRAGGLHLYDGHNHQSDVGERRTAVLSGWETVSNFRNELEGQGLPIPRIVAGGTGSFPIFAEIEDPIIELSPGTCVFHDAGYGEAFPDLEFTPAALLLTRVVSRPTPERVTLDLGYKAVASDPPAERRVVFPTLTDAKIVLQNEEHLVIETKQGKDLVPGDELLAVPRHICPTSALHKQAHLIENGKYVEAWEVGARDRWLTV